VCEWYNVYVPTHRKKFLKLWWNKELVAGTTRRGLVVQSFISNILSCSVLQTQREMMNTESYTNDLHEALYTKTNTTFWKCLRSKLESVNECVQVDGFVEADITVEKKLSYTA